MSDFEAFADDIAIGMEYLEHHQILGAKWGVMNGPPYPLGSGDHSSSEKKAAEAAGIKVGSDSGKGSIDNVKKKKSDAQNKVKKAKKEMTPEERRQAALEAVRSGDKKKIAKYINELSTDELRDAQARAQVKDSLKKQDPSEQKVSKEDVEKREAMLSGDKEKVKQYAEKMTYAELSEAMNKVDLMTKLNHVDPPPSAMDKLQKTAEAIGKFKDVAERGIGAYNVIAKIHNAANKDSQWPIIGEKSKEEKKEDKKEDKKDKKEKEETKEAIKKVGEEIEKTYKEVAKEKYENAKIDYKYDKKLTKWKAKQEAKAEKKNSQAEETEEKTTPDSEQPKQETQRQFNPERAPKVVNSAFNSKAKMSDYDDDISYDDLIPDDVKDVMNRKVS